MGTMVNRRRYMRASNPIITIEQAPHLIKMMQDMDWIRGNEIYKKDLGSIPNFFVVKTTNDNQTYRFARSASHTYIYKNIAYSTDTITFDKAGFNLVVMEGSDNADSYEFDIYQSYPSGGVKFFWIKGISSSYSFRNCFSAALVQLGGGNLYTCNATPYTLDEIAISPFRPLSSFNESAYITQEIETW